MTSRWGAEHVHHTVPHVGNQAGVEGSAKGELRSSPSCRAPRESQCPRCGVGLGGLLSAERDEESLLACSSAVTHGSPPRPRWCGAAQVGLQAGRESNRGTCFYRWKRLACTVGKARNNIAYWNTAAGSDSRLPLWHFSTGWQEGDGCFHGSFPRLSHGGKCWRALISRAQNSAACISVIRWMPMVMCIFHGSFSVCFGAGQLFKQEAAALGCCKAVHCFWVTQCPSLPVMFLLG